MVGQYLDGYDLGYGVQVSYVGYFDEEVEYGVVFMVYSDDVASSGFDLHGVADDLVYSLGC